MYMRCSISVCYACARPFPARDLYVQRSRNITAFAVIALTVLALSQLSSYVVNTSIPLGETVRWNSVVYFTHIRNMGGVFGMLQGHGWIFGMFSVALIAGLVLYLAFGKLVQTYEYYCFAFIAGGGLSNIVDRLLYGSVVDFINIQGIPFWQYIFNTADVMVHVGLWPMLYFSFFRSSEPSTPV
jgi:signal peptidase II